VDEHELLDEERDRIWLNQHPPAIEALQRHDPLMLHKVQIPHEAGYQPPRMEDCPVCHGISILFQAEFERWKLDRTRRMLSLNSRFNRERTDGWVYLAAEDDTIRRYPASQAYREGFSLYDENGNLTAPEEGPK
jgi:hypothetical protein